MTNPSSRHTKRPNLKTKKLQVNISEGSSSLQRPRTKKPDSFSIERPSTQNLKRVNPRHWANPTQWRAPQELKETSRKHILQSDKTHERTSSSEKIKIKILYNVFFVVVMIELRFLYPGVN